jgi:hypothetical protein
MFHSIDWSFVEGFSLHGIISYPTRKCGGHICDRVIVSTNTGSVGDSQTWPLRNVASFVNQDRFDTMNEPNDGF